MFLGLALESPSAAVLEEESWDVTEGGGRIHNKTGIEITCQGLAVGDISEEDIEVDQTSLLGHGAGGHVIKGYFKGHFMTGQAVALKVVPFDDINMRSQLLNDLRTLRTITNPFLIHLYAAYVKKGTNTVHVALEYMDYGSLADVKAKAKVVPQDMLALILIQILEGLKTLHLHFVVHRDVKLANILVNSNGLVKVTDFGISKQLDNRAFCETFVGTQTYLSPERVEGRDYSFPADIWSMGVCTFELATGSYPFGSIKSFAELYGKVSSSPEPRLDAGKYPASLCDFVVRCMQREPERRATAIQLVGHEYIQTGIFTVSQEQLIDWLASVMVSAT